VWVASADVAETKLAPEEPAHYTGTYEAPDSKDVFIIQEDDGHLNFRWGKRGARADQILHLGPLGNHRFALGRRHDGGLIAIDATYSVRVLANEGEVNTLELLKSEEVLYSAERVE